MQRLSAAVALLLSTALLVACAGSPRGGASASQVWALSPADLDAPLALQQHLEIERGHQVQAFEALLEADAAGLRLVVLAMGQNAMVLHWDGRTLDEQRAEWLPPQVDGGRVLQDLQFALWPLEALRQAAPEGARVDEPNGERQVFQDDRLIVRIHERDGAHFTLERPAEGYRLRVSSVALGGEGP